MPRPSRLDQQRTELTPLIADAFTELGYRRTTTAELARRCDVQVNILYRLWPDKKAMFIASLDHVHAVTIERWEEMARKARTPQAAIRRALDYEGEHLGQFGYHRLIFAGLSETDDPDIRSALSRMYEGFHELIRSRLEALPDRESDIDPGLAAWAVIALGTVSTIRRELGLTATGRRGRLLREVAKHLLRA